MPSNVERSFWPRHGLPLLLALLTFAAYAPSLQSDLVYDAEREIHEEGFITKASHLPDVLTLKVLGMNLALGPRPGQMLYLMLIAMVSGEHPFGYHLGSNLLHAVNVVLLFILLRRLAAAEDFRRTPGMEARIEAALAVVVLLFALHPVGVESVAEVSYSSSLLVAFFTFLALFAAMAFPPEKLRPALVIGGAGTLCAFAATTCKESGAATALLLIVYWFLYRRSAPTRPWALFLASALAVTAAFLAARFHFAPAPLRSLPYLGGSLPQVFLIQPQIWIFMIGKLLWPTGLSADYILRDLPLPSTPLAFALLALVLGLQLFLAAKSRMAALGFATFWLGLAAVSNLMPLNRIVADRFYYLPLAGLALELLAALLLLLPRPRAFTATLAILALALPPCAVLTVERQAVFAHSFALWTNTLRVSPHSHLAHEGLGRALALRGDQAGAIAQYRQAIALAPTFSQAHYNLGVSLVALHQPDAAMREYQTALALDPTYVSAWMNAGTLVLARGDPATAAAYFRRALDLSPQSAQGHYNLGVALYRAGHTPQAMDEYRHAFALDPRDLAACVNLGTLQFGQGDLDSAAASFQEALKIDPRSVEAHNDLGVLLLRQGRPAAAAAEFEAALQINPNLAAAQKNLAQARAQAAGNPPAP